MKPSLQDCHGMEHLEQLEHDFQQSGICVSYLAYSRRQNATAGTILQRCFCQIDQFRNRMGRSVCVFKVGLTSNPLVRFSFYKEANYMHMTLLHVSTNLGSIQFLEAALIAAHVSELGCRNQKYGGEGPPVSEEDFHFVYVVGARADQFKPIRWNLDIEKDMGPSNSKANSKCELWCLHAMKKRILLFCFSGIPAIEKDFVFC